MCVCAFHSTCFFLSFFKSLMVHWAIEHISFLAKTLRDWKRCTAIDRECEVSWIFASTSKNVQTNPRVNCAKICYPWKRKFIDLIFFLSLFIVVCSLSWFVPSWLISANRIRCAFFLCILYQKSECNNNLYGTNPGWIVLLFIQKQ